MWKNTLTGIVVIVAWACLAQVQAKETAEVRALTAIPGHVELVLSSPTTFRRGSLPGDARQGTLDRCYVDLSPASVGRQLRPFLDIESGSVRRVRVSQFRAGVVRVVLDLRSAQPCHVRTLTAPDRIVITAGVAPDDAHREPPSAGQPSEVTIPQTDPIHPVAVELPQSDSLTSPLTLLQTAPPLSSATPPFSTVPFLPSLCQEGQSEAAVTDLLTPLVSTGGSTDHSTQALANTQSPARSRLEEIPEEISIGGGLMHDVWLMAIGVGVLFVLGGGGVICWSKHRRRRRERDSWEQRMAHLEDAVNQAGILNANFFHSLELSQKRLEALLARTEWAEQNLRCLLAQVHGATAGVTASGQVDQYATATLLLSEGDGIQQVARALKLPLAQVRLLQELQQGVKKEKGADSPEKDAEGSLLNGMGVLPNGVFRNGTHLAQNGRAL